jgi:hypothetical protein
MLLEPVGWRCAALSCVLFGALVAISAAVPHS